MLDLRDVRRRALCLPWRAAAALGWRDAARPPVAFVVEKADWAIRWVGENIARKIEAAHPHIVATTATPERLANRVVHFGSQYMWLAWGEAMSPSNRYVTSFFHGKREDGPDVARHIDEFLRCEPSLSRIVASASLVRQRLIGWGVDPAKVVQIPIGVDMDLFRRPTDAERRAARVALGVPEGAIAIGSFQKDGVGWGDGMEPKLIKGPDLLVETLIRLGEDLPVFAVLTGPARGYVRRGLEQAGIPYKHLYAAGHAELVQCYHALDLYLVTSREEGGPMGLMESMSSGVPVVSTPVGMAPDLIVDGTTGGLTGPEDIAGLVQRSRDIIADQTHRAALLDAAHLAVRPCDWNVVARDHYEQVYLPLLQAA